MFDPGVTAVVFNPAAGNGRVGRQWARLEPELRAILGAVRFIPSEGPRGGVLAARRAVAAGARVVLSLGGDGTHNEVVNGILDASGGERRTFGFLPAGTGGDLARTIGMPRDTLDAARHVVAAGVRPLDVGLMHMTGNGANERRYFVNLASFGMSGLVDQFVNTSSKALGGRASFFIGSLRALAKYRPATVRVTIDDETLPDFAVNVLSVANGRYCGGGMLMAPEADPGDGLLDVVAIATAPLLQTLGLTSRIYKGSHVGLEFVRTFRARRVYAETIGPNPAYIDFDGEAPGVIPAEFTVVPHALDLLS